MTRMAAAFRIATTAAAIAASTAAPASGGQQEAAATPMTLDEAIATALSASPEIAAARAQVDRAAAERLASWGAFLPSLELGYDYLTSNTGRIDPTGQTFSTTSYTAELSGTYQIFDGFRKFAEISRAGRGLDAARAGARERALQTVLDVKTAYYAGVAEAERLEVETERVARLEEGLEALRIELERGRASRSDSLRAEVELAAARLERLRAEDASRGARFALGRAIGLVSPVEPVDPGPVDVESLPMRRDSALDVALREGPALARARADRQAAEAAVAAARSRYMPSIAVSGGWSWQSAEFPPSDGSWRVLVFGSLPLFDGFARESAHLGARANAAAARATERSAELQLRADLDAAYRQVEIAGRAVDLAETASTLAREEFAMSLERVRLGRESALEHRDAELALRRSELDLVRARFDVRVGMARLDYLMGVEVR